MIWRKTLFFQQIGIPINAQAGMIIAVIHVNSLRLFNKNDFTENQNSNNKFIYNIQ